MPNYINDKYKNCVGMLFGCFDLFHVGHIKYMENARKELFKRSTNYWCKKCDDKKDNVLLVVGVADNKHYYKLKGRKPIISRIQRLRIIQSCEYADRSFTYGTQFSKKQAVDELKPDIVFVSEKAKNKDEYEELGLPIVELPYNNKISSTIIKQRIKNE